MFREHFCCGKPLLALAALLFTLTQAHAQCDPHNPNPPSPPAQASVTLNGKPVTVDYCAPSLRGRQVGKEIAPYDKVWRTGANSATTLKTQSNLRIGDLAVPAGTYTIYSLPEEHGWKLIINKQTGQWGTVYKQDMDLGRTPMQGKTLSAPQEKMSISFENTSGNTTQLHIKWETTDEYVTIKAE